MSGKKNNGILVGQRCGKSSNKNWHTHDCWSSTNNHLLNMDYHVSSYVISSSLGTILTVLMLSPVSIR